MTGFENLPSEIVDRICTHLQDRRYYGRDFAYTPAAWKGLISLCSTSRRLNQVALPYLYHRIGVGGSLTHRLNSLTRSLLESPQLGDHIRELDLEEPYDEPTDEPQYSERDTVLVDYLASLPPTGLQGEVVNSDGSITGSQYWYTIRVLDLLFRRLRQLTMFSLIVNHDLRGNGSDISEDGYWKYILDSHKDEPSFLSQVHEISLHHCDSEGSLNFGSVIALIRRTKIRRLNLWSCSDESLQGVSTCALPSLLELRLENAALGESDLAKFVRWFPNLEYLLLDQPSLATVTEALEFPITANQACRAILPLKETLRTLVLFLDTDYDVEPIFSLVGLHKLRHLAIEMAALIEEDSSIYEPFIHKLPESLECLCLAGVTQVQGVNNRRWNKQVKSQRTEFLQLKEERVLPNLKKLIVSAMLGLESICNERDVEYREFDDMYAFCDEIAAEHEAWSTC